MDSMQIYVKNNNVNKAWSLLKKKLHEDGTFKEIRDRAHYISKGEKRRLAKKAGIARWKKKRQQLELQFLREERNQFRNRKRQPYKKPKK